MRKILILILVLIAACAKSQTIQYLGGPTTQIYVRGQLRVDTVVYLPLNDTTFTPSQRGAVVYKTSNNQLYLWTGSSWSRILIGSIAWGEIIGTLSNQTDLISFLSATYQPKTTFGYGLHQAGSTVTYDSALIRKVDTLYRLNDSTIQYVLNGNSHTVLLRGTAAGGISSLVFTIPTTLFNSPVTFSNSGGAWTGTATLANQNANVILAGPSVGSPSAPTFRSLTTGDLPINIPNGNLQNSSINVGLNTTGLTPAWDVSSVALGGSINLQVPYADPTHTGFLQATDWVSFQSRMVNFGNAPGWQTGTLAAIPAATTLLPGTHYTAVDSGTVYVDTGSGGTRGWKQISGGSAAITTANSIVGTGSSGNPIQLSGDASSPGNSKYYGTNSGGTRGFFSLPSSASGANPTGVVGLTAVNGSAPTFLRSDGAPALDVGISPTWTGSHQFNQPITVSNSGTMIISGSFFGTSSADDISVYAGGTARWAFVRPTVAHNAGFTVAGSSIGPGDSSGYLITTRQVATNFPVAMLIPTTAHKRMFLDIVPSDTLDYLGNGIATIDICNQPLDSSKNTTGALRLAAHANSVDVGSFVVGIAPLPDVHIIYGVGNTVIGIGSGGTTIAGNTYMARSLGSGSAPTTTSLGTNVVSATVTGTDRFMQIVIVTSGAVNGALCTITLSTTWPNTPIPVMVPADATTGTNVAGTTGGYFAIGGASTTTLTVNGKFTSAGTYTFNIMIGGN